MSTVICLVYVLNRRRRFLSIFLSRFLFDLRSLEDKDAVSSMEMTKLCFTPASSVDFVDRVADNIAAPLFLSEPDREGPNDIEHPVLRDLHVMTTKTL